MCYANHYAASEIEGPFKVPRSSRRAEVAVLGEGDELQVEVWLHLLLHLEQRLDREKAVVADIDMATHGKQALRDREIAIAQRSLGDRLMG